MPELLFRMLQPSEAAAGQAFPRTYIWDIPNEHGRPLSKRVRVRLIGNAVSPPVSRDISGVITEAYLETSLQAA